MTFDEMLARILEIFPNAEIREDITGEIVIDTRSFNKEGKILPLD